MNFGWIQIFSPWQAFFYSEVLNGVFVPKYPRYDLQLTQHVGQSPWSLLQHFTANLLDFYPGSHQDMWALSEANSQVLFQTKLQYLFSSEVTNFFFNKIYTEINSPTNSNSLTKALNNLVISFSFLCSSFFSFLFFWYLKYETPSWESYLCAKFR